MSLTKRDYNKLIGMIRKIFIDYTEPGGGKGYRFSHSVRVMRYCEKFLNTPFFRKFKLKKTATLVAALFHDIGKIKAANSLKEIKYRSKANKNHEKITLLLIENFLKRVIKSQRLREEIKDILKDLANDPPQSLEAKLIKDTDLLDNFGVIKIWRTIIYTQYQNRQINGVYEYWEEEGKQRAKKDLSRFYFAPIRSLALKRFKKLDQLIKEIKKEHFGADIK